MIATRRRTSCVFLSLLTTLVATQLAAAPPASERVAAQREAMAALDDWAGEWAGEGWAWIGPGRKHTFTMEETVAPRLQGLVLLIEGQGMSEDPETGEMVVSHDALAIVDFDPDAGNYRLHHHTMDGRSGVADLHRTASGLRWGFRDAQRDGEIRFTITLEDDRWHEVGEFSRDGGETWLQFLEMELERVRGHI